jgi:hypothetical protein
MTHGTGVTVRGGVVALNGTIFRGDSKRYFQNRRQAGRGRQAGKSLELVT